MLLEVAKNMLRVEQLILSRMSSLDEYEAKRQQAERVRRLEDAVSAIERSASHGRG